MDRHSDHRPLLSTSLSTPNSTPNSTPSPTSLLYHYNYQPVQSPLTAICSAQKASQRSLSSGYGFYDQNTPAASHFTECRTNPTRYWCTSNSALKTHRQNTHNTCYGEQNDISDNSLASDLLSTSNNAIETEENYTSSRDMTSRLHGYAN